MLITADFRVLTSASRHIQIWLASSYCGYTTNDENRLLTCMIVIMAVKAKKLKACFVHKPTCACKTHYSTNMRWLIIRCVHSANVSYGLTNTKVNVDNMLQPHNIVSGWSCCWSITSCSWYNVAIIVLHTHAHLYKHMNTLLSLYWFICDIIAFV